MVTFYCSIGYIHAQELEASDGASADFFGFSVSLSGSSAISGAYADDDNGLSSGSVYVFRNLDTAPATKTQNVKLTASDGAAYDYFGRSVSLSGNSAIAGARGDDGNGDLSGSAYVFRSLHTAPATKTQDVKLTASDGAAFDYFGFSVSLSGNSAIAGAHGNDDNGSATGSAYVFRNLDTAPGTKTQDVKLTASDGAASDYFGYSVSLSGNSAIAGAHGDDDNGSSSGSAYVFRNLDTAPATKTQDVKLTASDGAASDLFGFSVSLSGNKAIAGAYGDDDNGSSSGSAYVFRNLDTAPATKTQDVKLTASDGAASDYFGYSVSLSGNKAIAGAYGDDDNGFDSGSAYVFRNIDTATGTVTEILKLTASDGVSGDVFGGAVAMDGDRFVVGSSFGDGEVSDSGKAYTGTVSSMNTLDEGNATRRVDGISFESREDWVIGENTDNNQVTLGAGDSAEVLSSDKAVYIGKNEGSDNNTLIIEGSLTANEIFVGAVGNTGNSLEIGSGGSVTADRIVFASGSSTMGDLTIGAGNAIGGDGMINGDLTMTAGGLFEFEVGSTLMVTGAVTLDSSFGVDDVVGLSSSLEDGTYTLIGGTSTVFGSLGLENWGEANAYDLGGGKSAYFQEGSLQLVVIPEPASWVLAGLCLGTCFVYTRKR